MRVCPRTLLTGCAGALIAGLAAGCSAAPGLAYAHGATQPSSPPAAPSATAKVPPAAPSPSRTDVPPAPAPALAIAGAPAGVKAKEGILADAATGQVLWAKKAATELPMASITKVMTAYLVIQAGDLNRKIKVPKGVLNYVAKYGGESDALHPGEVLTTQELLYGLLIQSGADAAYTLAGAYGPGRGAFVAQMNAAAKRLGMDHTHFTSPDGLPYPTEFATYSTPQDLLTLGETAMRSPVFRSIVGMSQYHLAKGDGHAAHWWYSDNSLLRTYRGAVGIKTGYTDDAGHCLLFEAVRGGRTLMGVLLGSPPTGVNAAAQDATKVLNWGFALHQRP
jgi:serine-type D-Ala-D-Ala carboxypeptidase (penicillin-binding protein 5/6)